jgi:hypothetical protein
MEIENYSPCTEENIKRLTFAPLLTNADAAA